MAQVYRRYFEVKDAATLARIEELRTRKGEYNKEVRAFVAQIGADEAYTRNARISGITFTETTDELVWKRSRDGWMPRLNTKAGKAMQARIDGLNRLHRPEPLVNALAGSGLCVGCPVLLDAARGVGYSVGICGFPGKEPRWFASVPWRDVDPAKLAEYKANREGECTHWSAELDHLLWTPPAEWAEVKEWEVQKALDEYKEGH